MPSRVLPVTRPRSHSELMARNLGSSRLHGFSKIDLRPHSVHPFEVICGWTSRVREECGLDLPAGPPPVSSSLHWLHPVDTGPVPSLLSGAAGPASWLRWGFQTNLFLPGPQPSSADTAAETADKWGQTPSGRGDSKVPSCLLAWEEQRPRNPREVDGGAVSGSWAERLVCLSVSFLPSQGRSW